MEGDVNYRIEAGLFAMEEGIGCFMWHGTFQIEGRVLSESGKTGDIVCGTDCWTINNQQENKINVAEMIMLCWMCRKN